MYGAEWHWLFLSMGAVVMAWAVLLTIYDVSTRRLPDWLTLPAAGAVLVSAGIDIALEPFAGIFPSTPWWGLVWPALYVVLAWALGGVGGGDIKLALSLGPLVGGVGGVMAVLAAMMLSSIGTAAWAVSRQEKTAPHGPGMLVAAGLLIAFHL